MSPRARRTASILGGIGIGIAVLFFARHPARAQGMVRPAGNGVFHFTTNIGSFKLLGIEDQGVSGHFEMTANGTVLVTGVDKLPTVTGTLRLEKSFPKWKKYCYHGRGKLTLDGAWRSVQWFGTDLVGNFDGRGKFRLVGEFDKNLNTGWYWTTDPKDKKYWPANAVIEYLVPGYAPEVATPKAIPTPAPGGK
ncbi:MAG: hypothetical protein ACYC96_08375 [Fimbriimonadaceae bacterium]